MCTSCFQNAEFTSNENVQWNRCYLETLTNFKASEDPTAIVCWKPTVCTNFNYKQTYDFCKIMRDVCSVLSILRSGTQIWQNKCPHERWEAVKHPSEIFKWTEKAAIFRLRVPVGIAITLLLYPHFYSGMLLSWKIKFELFSTFSVLISTSNVDKCFSQVVINSGR